MLNDGRMVDSGGEGERGEGGSNTPGLRYTEKKVIVWYLSSLFTE